MKVQWFQEIAVKHLNAVAITYPKLPKYRPDTEQLPARCLSVTSSSVSFVSNMKEIVTKANKKLFAADSTTIKKDGIRLSDEWLEELMKHSNYPRKPATGVYLLRKSTKVSKEVKYRKLFKLSKRLGAEEEKDDGNIFGPLGGQKFKKGNDRRPDQLIAGGIGNLQIDLAGFK